MLSQTGVQPRCLWNNAMVLLIITPQYGLVLSFFFMKKTSPVTTSTWVEWISVTLIFSKRVKWLQCSFSCHWELANMHLAHLALRNTCLFAIYLCMWEVKIKLKKKKCISCPRMQKKCKSEKKIWISQSKTKQTSLTYRQSTLIFPQVVST